MKLAAAVTAALAAMTLADAPTGGHPAASAAKPPAAVPAKIQSAVSPAAAATPSLSAAAAVAGAGSLKIDCRPAYEPYAPIVLRLTGATPDAAVEWEIDPEPLGAIQVGPDQHVWAKPGKYSVRVDSIDFVAKRREKARAAFEVKGGGPNPPPPPPPPDDPTKPPPDGKYKLAPISWSAAKKLAPLPLSKAKAVAGAFETAASSIVAQAGITPEKAGALTKDLVEGAAGDQLGEWRPVFAVSMSALKGAAVPVAQATEPYGEIALGIRWAAGVRP